MTQEEIVKAAIEKAAGAGFQWDTQYWRHRCVELGIYEPVIFSHNFAKAFWNESKEEWAERVGPGIHPRFLTWRDYLQQMVLEEDPIRYLEKFLDKEAA